jgi:hypothetical protein
LRRSCRLRRVRRVGPLVLPPRHCTARCGRGSVRPRPRKAAPSGSGDYCCEGRRGCSKTSSPTGRPRASVLCRQMAPPRYLAGIQRGGEDLTGRQQRAAHRVVQLICAMSVRAIQTALADSEHPRDTVRAAIRRGVSTGAITTERGHRGAILHRACERARRACGARCE